MRQLIAILIMLTVSVAVAQQPNIIVVLTDDQGYADVGFNGATDIMTPRLDALAQGGTVFSSAYVVHPFCGPSRMALMTGRYPHAMGTPYNLPDVHKGIERWNVKGVPVSETLMSTMLQDAGYYTGAIGKWHLGAVSPEYHPNARGFDDFYGFLGGGHKYYPLQYSNTKGGPGNWVHEYLWPIEHNGVDVPVTASTEYLTDELSNEAARFISEASQLTQPFFLYVAYNAPHAPMDPKPEDYNLYANITNDARRKYAAMVHSIDRGVGQIVDTLIATGEYDNTLIVFLSDNGGVPTQGASNSPLRGRKGDTWEGGYRVPMMFHWPGHVPAGHTYEHPVSALDFYPTFAGLANATIPASKQLDGKNIWHPLLADTSARAGEMIYVLRHRLNWHDIAGRRDQWKVVRKGVNSIYQNPWQLFNVAEDLGENNDLRSTYPALFEEMVAELEEWTNTHKDTVPRWFWSEQEEEYWQSWGMPRYGQTFNEDSTITAIDNQEGNTPVRFKLRQNYPNPFNPTTNIAFELERDAEISLDIFNVQGQHIANLVSGKQRSGQHNIEWQGIDGLGRRVASGMYIYSLRIDGRERHELLNRKMVLLK